MLPPGIKRKPLRRWQLPDRIFFGHGACHILTGVYLSRFNDGTFHALWMCPPEPFTGTHIFATNGEIAFDHHGYSVLNRLLDHYRRAWSRRQPGWSAVLNRVDFSLLDTAALNARRMRGPGQYYRNPIPRAVRYLDRIDHTAAREKAEKLLAQAGHADPNSR